MPNILKEFCHTLNAGFVGGGIYMNAQTAWGMASYGIGSLIVQSSDEEPVRATVLGNILGGAAVGVTASIVCLKHRMRHIGDFSVNEFAKPLLPVLIGFLPFAGAVVGDAIGNLNGWNCKNLEKLPYSSAEEAPHCLDPDPFLSNNGQATIVGGTILTSGLLLGYGSYLFLRRHLQVPVAAQNAAYRALDEEAPAPIPAQLAPAERANPPHQQEGVRNEEPNVAGDNAANNLLRNSLFRPSRPASPLLADAADLEGQQLPSAAHVEPGESQQGRMSPQIS